MNEEPLFSIIIPAFNEEGHLLDCIKSINDQEGEISKEIIIANNNSTDKTGEIARESGVKVVDVPEKGVGRARRVGTAQAKGVYILNIDADTRLPKNYLIKVLKRFKEDSSLVSVGGQIFFNDAPWWKNVLRFLIHRLLWIFAVIISGGKIGPMGNNMTFKKEIYDKVCGFNEKLKFGEDMDLTRQLSKFGKVRLDMNLKCCISARRYEINKKLITYLLNFIKMTIFGTPYENNLVECKK